MQLQLSSSATLPPSARSLKWTVCVVCIAVAMTLDSVAEAQVAAAPDRELAELVLSGILAERQRLQSGVIVVSGTRFANSPAEPDVSGPVDGLYAFEKESDRLRYDNEEPHCVRYVDAASGRDLSAEALSQVAGIPFRRRLCYARNRDYSASWTRDGPSCRSHIQLRKTHESMGGLVARIHHLYDLQAVGLMSFLEFEEGVSAKASVDALRQMRVVRVLRGEDQVTLHLENDVVRNVITVDAADGYRPTERVMTSLTDPASSTTRTRWSRQNGVDVPSEMRIRWDVPQLESVVEYHLKFAWQSVNEKVADGYFDYGTFPNVPRDLGIRIIDGRSGGPVDLGEW